MKIKWQKLLFVVFAVIFILILTIEITPFNDLLTLPLVYKEPLGKREVIIVLGGGIKKNGSLAEQTTERVNEGLYLLRENYASKLIMAGGQAKNGKWPESEKMRDYALSLGENTQNILNESGSKNTYENAVNSLALMAKQDLKDAVVVTSPYHTKRACLIFKKLKAEITCQPVEKKFLNPLNPWEKIVYFKAILREYGAFVYFKIKGYI